MSYRLIDSNAIAIKYPEVNEMPCVFANLPDGMNGQFIDAQPTIQPEVLACGNGELVAQPEPQWIPVERELPEPRIDVWVNSDLGQMVGYYDETVELWYGRDYLELIVNAWMPLPAPYQKGATP